MQLIYTNLGIFVLLVSSFIDITISETRVVCYYTNWSVYRPGTAKFNPQNINPYLCTHLIYSFGGFTKDNQLKPFDKYQDIEQGGYAKFTGLKTYNKELKTMLAIGGWNEGSTRFSPLVASADRRAQLVKNAIKFLRQNKFDGLDLDWEYPAFRDGGKPKDRENYAKLVQELREEFDREHQKTGRPRLLLTMAVPAGFEYIDKGYDVPKLNKYLDWFNLLSYDYHSAYEPAVNHHAPLYPIEEENEYSFDNDLNINATINYYLKNGAERDKLVLGIPTYGRSYTLFNPDSNEIGAPADGPGEQGDATREKGYLAYYEICQSLREEDSEWTVVQPNPDALGPYAYKDNQWVGYDDEDIVRRKSEFVVEQKLGGIMFWSIDNDDFRGLCGGKPYPLIEAAKEAYIDGLENGVQRKTKFDANKRKQQTTTTRKPEAKKSGKTTTPAPPTTPSSGSDFKCEDEGFFSHPTDCAKYFWCLEAPGLGIVAHHFSCPSGLVFNKAADSCDYARNVYCTNKAPKTTTTSEAPIIWTTTTKATTTEKPSYNKVSSIYKNPSRTTTRTTTTPAPIEIDTSDLEQEDPKVIKELIELIKKAGGIEELEKQIHIQEESATGKPDPKATTPATIINKSIVERFKNRASLFKPRPAPFNGASQPERKTEQKATTEKVEIETKEEKPQLSSKKYNSINRFSRPEPQSAGIDKIPESDAVLIEKPQYTSIQRRKPVKPDVITENDYNNDSDRNSEEESPIDVRSSSDSEVTKKYASISRPRKPQEQVEEEEEDDDEDDDEIVEEIPTTTARTFAPTTKSIVNKYTNLNRRRSTTPSPDEKSDEQVSRSSVSPRRRVQQSTTSTTTEALKTTSKTVLDINTNNEYKINPRNTLDYTLSKNTATDIERETLIANKHIHDDDINHIALPTESVTENISIPDGTQIPITISPQFNDDDKVNELIDGITEGSDIDITTVSSEDIIDSGISETNIDDSNDKFIAPRPFTRSKPSQNTSPSPSPLPSRNFPSRSSTEPKSETTRASRRRPSVTRTFVAEVTDSDDDFAPKTPRPTYTYRQGYRGTARFRGSTSKSGQYERENQQFLEDNRLRSLNVDRLNKRPSTSTTTTEKTVSSERPTRRRPTVTRTSTAAPELEEDSTTEARIVEHKNRFNIGPDERPDRVRFELTAGGKINFGFNSVKARENAAKDSDAKLKVITGPLDKSPLVISGRELKKGHVEEIPIQTSPETVTIQNFSEKLELGEIPLNKSDIESFVPDEDLRTDLPALEETTLPIRRRQRPSISGFKKRTDESEKSEDVSSTTERVRGRGFTSRKEISNESDRTSSRRERTRGRIQSTDGTQDTENAFPRKSQLRIETNQSPRGFQSRPRNEKVEIESSTAKYLTKVKASAYSYRGRQNSIADSENSETQDVPEESTLRTFLKYNSIKGSSEEEETTVDIDVLDLITEKSVFGEQENEIDFTTVENDENDITENPFVETTTKSSRRVAIRKKPKKIDSLANRQTITEPANDLGKTAEYESTSSLSVTASDDDEEYETEIETASDRQAIDTTSSKPTRRVLVSRTRVNNSDENEKPAFEVSTSPKTTRKRILTIRTRNGVIQSAVPIGNFETTEPPKETDDEEKIRIDEPDVAKRILKVKKLRPTTERLTEESSTHKPIVTRTRVFKRPVLTQEEKSDASEGEVSTSERTKFSPSRTRVKITRRPLTTTTQVGEEEQVQTEENVQESSTTRARKGFKKVLKKIKTPRVIVNEPLEEDSVVIQTDDENQQIDQVNIEKLEEKEENIEIENLEGGVSEEPSSPVAQTPTRPVGRVTIKKRPSFNRLSTVHPASTRFANQGGSRTRVIITTKKAYRPGSAEALGERNKKIFTKYRKTSSTTTTLPPNITPHNNIDIETETNEYDENVDTTDFPQIINNNGILQTVRPRFKLTPTTSTTPKPTTLHHVFAIDIDEDDMNKLKNAPENQADEVIKKLQKLIEINRIVEVYSKEEKLKLLKNKKLKSIKAGELTLERPPALDKFGEITREVIIKLSVKQNTTAAVNSTTDKPNETRSPKNIMFSETVFGSQAETSTISLEGLFEREKKELELKKAEDQDVLSVQPIYRPESSGTISKAKIEQVILNNVKAKLDETEKTTTDSPESDETTTLVNDD